MHTITPAFDDTTDLLTTLEHERRPASVRPKFNHMNGQLIANRYRVHEQVGRGGMSDVYLAHDHEMDKAVAIKLGWPPIRCPSTFNSIMNEGQILPQLQHTNIVTIHDVGYLSNGRMYLVLEWIPGKPLSKCLDLDPISPQKALRIFDQTLQAIEHAHHHGFAHCDISPNNIMVQDWESSEPVIKLIDFGLSAPIGHSYPKPSDDGSIRGTPTCIAPYRIRGEPNNRFSDYYGLGVILYRCLTGRYPFKGQSVLETLRAHLRGIYLPVTAAPIPVHRAHFFQALMDLLLDPFPCPKQDLKRQVHKHLSRLRDALEGPLPLPVQP